MNPRMAEFDLTFETLVGTALHPLLPDLARLRITVFREWPYLYEGDEVYERTYLGAYADAPGAAVVVCRDGDGIVGAATCEPMTQGHPPVRKAFEDSGNLIVPPMTLAELDRTYKAEIARYQGIARSINFQPQ